MENNNIGGQKMFNVDSKVVQTKKRKDRPIYQKTADDYERELGFAKEELAMVTAKKKQYIERLLAGNKDVKFYETKIKSAQRKIDDMSAKLKELKQN